MLCENHASRLGLKRASHYDLYRLIDFVATAFDDHHSAIIQVTNPLLVAFAWLDDTDLKIFAWQVLRAER